MMMAAALVLAVTLAQATAPGMPPQLSVPSGAADDMNPKGTAVIKGRITAADTGRPLRRARITVTGAPLFTPQATSTNVRGEYEVKDLPAGRYQLRVQRSGYLPMHYGQRRSTEPARPFDVADGQALEKVDFALVRTGIISGRVVDETGEPVAGVAVRTMRQEYFLGRRGLVPVGPEGKTDDTGRYRVLNVPPGEYLMMAMLREIWVAGPKRETYGYAPTFFPGTARAADATQVKVTIGQEVPNTDFALVAARAASLTGTATSADGAPLAGARVSLSADLVGPNGGMFMGVRGASVGADSSWSIRDIPPGEYQLEASSPDRNRRPARAHMTIQVQGADINGITLVTDSGGTLTGQVVTDTGEALPASSSRMRVAAESLTPGQRAQGFVMGDDNGVVGPDGAFTLTGAFGRSVVRLWSLPKGWVLKSVEGPDQDYSETPVDVRGGQKLDLRIVITSQFPYLTGRISDDRGNPVEGAVLLFPSDTAKWFDTGVLRLARPDQSGVFRIESVRPGDYLAVALEVVESWQINDPDFLEELRSRATRVIVREGQTEVLSLKVAR